MKTLPALMDGYGEYHQHPLNVATHYVGVPAIMFGVLVALGWVRVQFNAFDASLAWLVFALVSAYYIKLDLRVGLFMLGFDLLLLVAADHVSRQPLPQSFTVFLIAFGGGWILQAIGHVIEGRKPAFFDDVRQLFVGPIYLMTKLLIGAGLLQDVRDKIGDITTVG